MEYRKEDLMEAKKQILGVGENMGTEESTETKTCPQCGLTLTEECKQCPKCNTVL